MTGDILMEAVGMLPEDIIQEAERERHPGKGVLKYAFAAACLCAAVLGTSMLLPKEETPEELPMLTVSASWEGMGYEGLLYYGISELENGNPWTEEMEITSLPAYQNNGYSAQGIPWGLDEPAMEEKLASAATALGWELTQTKKTTAGKTGGDIDPDAVISIKAQAQEGCITVEADGRVLVTFAENPLPEEYAISYTDSENWSRALPYLAEKFDGLLGFADCTSALFFDRDIYGGNHYMYYAYDAGGDDTADILRYAFADVAIGVDDAGGVTSISLYDSLACMEKLGDYPIIDSAQALSELLEGNYVTSVPYELPGEEYVAKTELVYRRNTRHEETVIPYYRFYVELPQEERENGLKTYGAYYVPAVDGRYIENMSVYDGAFN